MKDPAVGVQFDVETTRHSGMFGNYGGAYVPEVLAGKLTTLAATFREAIADPAFRRELKYYLRDFVGRPSPLYLAERLSAEIGARIYLKREDLNHTGAHKINNTVGQALLAKRLGAKTLIAETGAGQHGVATATVAALFGMKCIVFMGSEDVRRQAPNVERMKLLGAELVTTDAGTATLKDAVDAALGYYIQHPDVFYCLGSAVGPHPYPSIVREFQSVIGAEARTQILEAEGRLPDILLACVGGGSNAIGLFSAFLGDPAVEMFGAEGGGTDVAGRRTAATLTCGKPTVFQGTYSYCLVDEQGQPVDAYSVSAGLDYPGIGPEHAYLKDTGRVQYAPVMDDQAIAAFRLLSRSEGIIPAIESAHAVALASQVLRGTGKLAIINLSGRGDKDIGRF
ncbi:MAG: tryptophan synthase subunit beta [Spirochaetes bacterium GWD1_61_31]|nr:MAG: tryptophan synthase subunit beta [Spirochaetes bacterium GWB1_60_80]OHD37784.1 MAG: tryptophan synthase subunit beta [Spirochaetes bacterium GWD1_61_31]OHD42745.1 MAG: tryptophan synthase subunit beta [Spirochaetes bacterium GWE1_60_18]OHD58596.1 MAG: tryptophan synthase subunit beta [Spirochaetes bacterium GWF1_60_12]HAP44430.1 tryptophan synthase subunit beta [Spirochaetaceae bacterium]